MKYCKKLIVIAFCFGLFQSINAQIVVIVNKGNPSADVTLVELKKIFLGDKGKWGNGNKIVLVDQKSNKEVSKKFYAVTTGKSLSAVKESWIKKMLTGAMSPLKVFGTDAEIVSFVSQNAGAVGFVEVKKSYRFCKSTPH